MPKDVVRLVNKAIELQQHVFLNVIAIAAFLFLLGLLFELLRLYSAKRDRNRQTSPASLRRQNFHQQISLAFLWLASAFTLAASIANTQTVKALEMESSDALKGGKISLVLHWTNWALSMFFAIGMSMFHGGNSGARYGGGFGTVDDPMDIPPAGYVSF